MSYVTCLFELPFSFLNLTKLIKKLLCRFLFLTLCEQGKDRSQYGIDVELVIVPQFAQWVSVIWKLIYDVIYILLINLIIFSTLLKLCIFHLTLQNRRNFFLKILCWRVSGYFRLNFSSIFLLRIFWSEPLSEKDVFSDESSEGRLLEIGDKDKSSSRYRCK